jgi:hypothetical protein
LTWSFPGRRDTPHLHLAADDTFDSVAVALAALEESRADLRARGAVAALLLDRATLVGEYRV